MRGGIEVLTIRDKPSEWMYLRWQRQVSERPNMASEVGVTILGLYDMT